MRRIARASPATLALALALAAILAQGAGIPVSRDPRLAGVFAERVEISERLEVFATTLDVLPAETIVRPGSAPLDAPCPELPVPALPALPGTAPNPCENELSAGMPLASNGLRVGDWVYTVSLRERRADAAREGERFEVELRVDGARSGLVALAQQISEPAAREGARVAFGLGRDPPLSPQFVVLVRTIEPAAGVHELRAVSDVDLQYRWKEGTVTNPTLAAASGALLRFDIVHDDATGSTHNLRVKDAGGTVVAGPSADIDPASPNARLEWTPAAPGTFRYECKYHSNTQFGTIEVS